MGRIMKYFVALFLISFCCSPTLFGAQIDLTQSYVSLEFNSKLTQKARDVLIEEISKRSSIVPHNQKVAGAVEILVGLEADFLSKGICVDRLKSLDKLGDDGYKIIYDEPQSRIIIAAERERATFYGVGHLLRKLNISSDKLMLGWEGDVATSPVNSIRGYELHPNPKSKNQDEPWVIEQFEQYLREMVLFGANSIEVLRRISPTYIDLCKSYGLDIWLVTFNNGPDFKTEKGLQNELKMRRNVLTKFPALDHLMIKSGDPGDQDLDTFLDFSAKEAALLREIHPNAKIWVSPQRFIDAPESYFDEFIDRINSTDWVDGVAFGPWTRTPLPELRARLKKELPIRNFPDISHLYSCQFPLPDVDPLLAMCLGRIAIYPVPKMQKYIHNFCQDYVVGTIAYSEGTGDDINKYIWLGQDWDPTTEVEETLRDYARFFIGAPYVDEFVEGVLSLEKNHYGPLATNENIDNSLRIWQSLESKVGKETLDNPRFAMCLLRGYYDSFIKTRLLYEKELERRAYDTLSKAKELGSAEAIKQAKESLLLSRFEPVAMELKKRCRELYSLIYLGETGRWTMEYQKCVLLEQIDVPLNNERWIMQELGRIELIVNERQRVEELAAIPRRTTPENGLYFNLGTFDTASVVDTKENWKTDPYYLQSAHRALGAAMSRFVITARDYQQNAIPMEWLSQAGIYYDQPMTITFKGLEQNQKYTVKVVYIGEMNRFKDHKVKMSSGNTLIHDYISPTEYEYIFPLPQSAVKDGEVTLTWQCNQGGRGVQVAEVFFLKK